MKVALLFPLASIIVHVLSYDLYGGYERMYLYYAYLIDGQKNDGVPRKIAPHCARYMEARSGMCNFNQFIQYINDRKHPISIDDSRMPDVDRTANALVDAGDLTGEYKISLIMDDIH